MGKYGKIVVVGSSNIDMVVRVSHLPMPGETVGQAQYNITYGGKGANQAVAAAKTGGEVVFVSCLGTDAYADLLLSSFESVGIQTQYIYKCTGQSTGTAFILVDDNGENCIAVAAGANDCLVVENTQWMFPLLEQAEVLVLQLEIPYETVLALIEYAYQLGKKIVLNLAPARKIPFEVLKKIDILILNETEAIYLTEGAFQKSQDIDVVQYLHGQGVKNIILTLGSKGVLLSSLGKQTRINSYKVKVVDTTGAGDTFCGTFVTKWLESDNLYESVCFATAASALSVTKLGAQSSIPSRNEIEDFLLTKSNDSK